MSETASWYWSSTTYAYFTNYAWFVYFYFGNGYVNFNYKYDSDYARAVRGGQPGALGYSVIWPFDTMDSGSSDDVSTATGGYADNVDGTVTDTSTGLMWQQQAGSSTQTWEQALAYCEGLNLGGHTDWRLPSIKELQSINKTMSACIPAAILDDLVCLVLANQPLQSGLFGGKKVSCDFIPACGLIKRNRQ